MSTVLARLAAKSGGGLPSIQRAIFGRGASSLLIAEGICNYMQGTRLVVPVSNGYKPVRCTGLLLEVDVSAYCLTFGDLMWPVMRNSEQDGKKSFQPD